MENGSEFRNGGQSCTVSIWPTRCRVNSAIWWSVVVHPRRAGGNHTDNRLQRTTSPCYMAPSAAANIVKPLLAPREDFIREEVTIKQRTVIRRCQRPCCRFRPDTHDEVLPRHRRWLHVQGVIPARFHQEDADPDAVVEATREAFPSSGRQGRPPRRWFEEAPVPRERPACGTGRC